MHLYIELFKAKESWLALSADERAAYLQKAGGTMQGVLEAGAEVVGVGAADPETSHDAGYDCFAVWKLPNREVVQAFERGIDDDDWYAYFEQVNASGESGGLEALMGRLIGL